MEQVDVIFYINLESRTDRKEHFLKEIKKLCIDECKIIRIDAVKHSNGALGCTKSHIKALDLFMANPLWDTCMVFEDDFTFYDTSFKNNNELIKIPLQMNVPNDNEQLRSQLELITIYNKNKYC